MVAERGPNWQRYQVAWKLASPYAERRGLSGLDGLIELYRAYREITDDLVNSLGIEALTLETSSGDWPHYRRMILDFVGLPVVDDTDVSWQPRPSPTKSGR